MLLPVLFEYISSFRSHTKDKKEGYTWQNEQRKMMQIKNKQGFDSSTEFSKEFGSANANQAHKNKAKRKSI
ncbi:hypothetical protein KEH51_01490 [[Brevibacterium] frigoritolerans]|uniref:Uncharacterized protein n=1 Tax=Peribacillus frigoritolerans TaxID=450367 RepID=A0A941J6P8_9BACI|nr:hypothetical protein [Peribacillus frigoritolerans]